MKERSHDLTFYCTHNESIRSIFRVQGIYNFVSAVHFSFISLPLKHTDPSMEMGLRKFFKGIDITHVSGSN